MYDLQNLFDHIDICREELNTTSEETTRNNR